jgi:hypothetical protein
MDGVRDHPVPAARFRIGSPASPGGPEGESHGDGQEVRTEKAGCEKAESLIRRKRRSPDTTEKTLAFDISRCRMRM